MGWGCGGGGARDARRFTGRMLHPVSMFELQTREQESRFYHVMTTEKEKGSMLIPLLSVFHYFNVII